MIIEPPEVIEDGDNTTIRTNIEYAGKKERLWYSVDKKYGQYLTSERLDGFVVGLLPLAMELREDITVKGLMSEKLYYNLMNYYMAIYQLAVPTLTAIKIYPQKLTNSRIISEEAVGTGFSGGVDSFYTISRHLLDKDIPSKYKITCLVFSNVGGHQPSGENEKSIDLFESRYEMLKSFPQDMGLDYIKIDSNLSDIVKMAFYKNFQLSYLSSPLLLQKLFGKYYFASGFSYKDSHVCNVKDIAYTDSAAVHLLSTESLDIISSGGEVSRIEKTRAITCSGIAKHRLNVCQMPHDDGKNCSICVKCNRTLITLELLGCVDQYSDVFDLKKWRSVRNMYIIDKILRKSDDSLINEIKDYAKLAKYKFSSSQKLAALILNVTPGPIYRTLKGLFIKTKMKH
jgi:hypothetical protein